MIFLYVFIFIVSCALLVVSSKLLVDALEKLALFLRVREFIIAFFLMAFGASIPNMVVGVISATQALRQNNPALTSLSLGDIMGGNIIDLSLALGLAILFSCNGIEAQSRMVQMTSFATIFFATLPLLLMSDGMLSRIDGIIMICGYLGYALWIFSEKERFTRPYERSERKPSFKVFTKNFFLALFGIVLLILGGYGIVESAQKFSLILGLPLSMIGLFIVALGNCSPEIFFSIQAARKKQEWMVLGDLMGGVIFCASFVLGLVALISPIMVENFSFSIISRAFLVLICLFFIFSVRNDRRLSKLEGVILILLYVLFLLSEIVLRDQLTILIK